MSSQDRPIVSPVLIGRTGEVEKLFRALDAARQGRGQCLLLTGEAGLGKSRLVAEARARAAQAGFALLQGNCFEQDCNFPYAPWIDALRADLGRRDAAAIREELGPALPEFVKLLPELKLIVPDAPASPALEPEAEKRRLFETLAQFLARLSGRQPMLIVLEDLHWSDESSLELVHYLARRIAGRPVLRLGTYRSDEVSPPLGHLLAQFDRERLAQEIALGPLTRDEISAMVQAIFGLDQPIRSDFLDRVVPLAEGNPFFLEEILRSLIEAGDIFDAGGAWERRPASDLHVPRTVRDAVERRMERLTPDARNVLLLAAVAGQRFALGLVQELTTTSEADLVQRVRELMSAQLVVELSADEFAFRHALTHEAVYSTLLVRERRALHGRVAETMERLYAEDLDRHVAELAYHYFQAGAWDKALEYARRAGEKAQALYATREAVAQFTRALEAARQLGLKPPLPLLQARATAYETLGDFEPARTDYEAAVDLARQEPNQHAEWQALLDMGFFWNALDFSRSEEYFRGALDLARKLGDPKILGHTLNRVGNWLLNRDQSFEARRYHEEALDIFQELGDPHGLAETLELLGLSNYSCGDPIHGATYCQQSIPLFRQVNERYGLVNSMAHTLLPNAFETEIVIPIPANHVEATAEAARQIAREMGWRAGESLIAVNVAEGIGPLGYFERALSLARQGLQGATEIGHRTGMGMSCCALGQRYLDVLAFEEARQELERGLAISRENNQVMFTHVAAAALPLTYIAQGDLDRAEATIHQVLGNDAGPLTRHQRMASYAQAQLELARGHPDRVLQIVDRLIDAAPNVEVYGRRSIPRLSHLRGQALFALGRPEEAEEELRAAIDVARAQGKRGQLWASQAELGKVLAAQKRDAEAEQEWAQARALVEELARDISDESLRANFLQRALDRMPAHAAPPSVRVAKKEFGGLTARERQVAVLVAQGKSNREVADDLVIAERTVERHVANIMSKLGFNSRTQIAAWAVEKGLARSSR